MVLSSRGTSDEDAEGKPHPAGPQAAEVGELARSGVQGCGDRPRVTREHAPGLREAHAPAGAGDQGHPDPALQPAQVLTDRRLAVAERFRRTRDRTEVGDGAHDAEAVGVEVVEQHSRIITRMHVFDSTPVLV